MEYVTLNAIDFTDASVAWSNPSTSAHVHYLPDLDVDVGATDSMVEATLHQLNIATNPVDNEPIMLTNPLSDTCLTESQLRSLHPHLVWTMMRLVA